MNNMRNKILSLLVLLLTAASGAWAQETPLVTITFGYSGPVYSESGIVTVTGSNYDPQSNSGKYSWTPNGTISLMSATVEPAAGYNITKVVFWSNDNGNYANALEDTAEPYVCYSKWSEDGKSLSDDFSNKVNGYNIAKIEVYGTYEPPLAVEPVTGKTDEWQLTMPAGNVLIEVAYKDLTAMALTFDGKAIPAAGVKGFLGFEQEFIDGLNLDAAVTNTDQNGAAVTTDATSYTYTSSDATVIGFKTATEGVYELSGALADMEFRQEGSATLTIQYAGTEDLGKSAETALLVTVTEKTYTVELADNTADADNWQGKIGDNGTYAALPIEGLKGSEKVVLKYDGSRIVKRVTATVEGATVPVETITLNKTETTITKVNGTATETLSVTAVTPDEATDKTVTWSSDNTAAATVDASTGVVTAVAEGTAHIRATANDGSGVYGECTVTVTDLSAYYSKMVECGCDDLDGLCANGANPSSPFTGQVLTAAQAIALAQAKAAETSSNCAVFYGNGSDMGQIAFAKNDGTTGLTRYYYDAGTKGLSGYRGFYVSK